MATDMTFSIEKKLWSNSGRVGELMKTGRTVPILVEVLPTNTCNAKCSFCFYRGTHSREMIKREAMLKILSGIAEFGVKAVNWSGGGEPSLHPDFMEFTQRAHELGLGQGLFTNAIDTERVNPEMFSWIRISETDKGFADFIIEAIRKWKDKTKVGYCINLLPGYSKEKLMETAEGLKRAGAHYLQVRPALAGSVKEQNNVIFPLFLKDYEGNGFRVFLSEHKFNEYLKPHGYDTCLGCWLCPCVHYNGKLMTCEYWFDKAHEIGDLNTRGFKEIWQSEETGKILNSLPVLGGCQHCCRNHELNKFLYWLKNGGDEDADFL